jgi:mRNA interferase MazF
VVNRPGAQRGEVWWAEPPYGRHPVIVLTRSAAIPVLRDLLVMPVTTTMRGIPTEVVLDESDGMPRRCVATADNTGPLSAALLVERITALAPARMGEICDALNLAVGCS